MHNDRHAPHAGPPAGRQRSVALHYENAGYIWRSASEAIRVSSRAGHRGHALLVVLFDNAAELAHQPGL